VAHVLCAVIGGGEGGFAGRRIYRFVKIEMHASFQTLHQSSRGPGL
jgi:hypothetical protein